MGLHCGAVVSAVATQQEGPSLKPGWGYKTETPTGDQSGQEDEWFMLNNFSKSKLWKICPTN